MYIRVLLTYRMTSRYNNPFTPFVFPFFFFTIIIIHSYEKNTNNSLFNSMHWTIIVKYDLLKT
jgi:hypothetical protein